MSDEEPKTQTCTFTFKKSGRGRGRGGIGQRKRCNKSDSSSSSEDETSIVKATRERKKNPMVQKSHLFKKHRTDDKDDDHDSDEANNAATKGFGSTGVSYKTTGAELKNEMKENTFATREVDTAMDRDQRTIEERREEVMKATEGKEDDKVYRGLNNYAQYIEKREAIQGKRLATKGPIRAPTNIRSTVRWDYDPMSCKDYRETGICGFGDSCKFMHDRGDYKFGWQLEQEWDDAQKAKENGKAPEDSSDDEKYVIDSDDDDNLPKKCPFCRKVFNTPVITRCKHYFCEKCALDHYKKSQRCYECGKQTGGVFNPAKELVERIRKREEAGKTYSDDSDDERLPDESAPVEKAIPEDDPDYYTKVHDPYEDDHRAHESY